MRKMAAAAILAAFLLIPGGHLTEKAGDQAEISEIMDELRANMGSKYRVN